MKKRIYILLIALFIFLPINVFASGYIKPSVSSLKITKGDTKSFTITASNAIGDATISSSDSSVASVNSNEWATGAIGEGDTKKGTIKVTGKAVGTAKITIVVDGATFDEEKVDKTYTITVTVEEKTTTTTTTKVTTTTSKKTSTTVSTSKTKKSDDCDLNTLKVEGYTLTKVDKHHYTLKVDGDVEKIKIKATADSNKATITGNGEYEVKNGENDFLVVITAENGDKNKIHVLVTKGESVETTTTVITTKPIESSSLEELLKSDNDPIELNETKEVFSSADLEAIKNSGKKVVYNVYDGEDLSYSWIIDGSKLNSTNELNTEIVLDNEEYENIKKDANYVDGIFLSFKESVNIPEGVTIKYNLKNQFDKIGYLNIYSYKDKFELIDTVSIEDGYIEFDPKTADSVLITPATLDNKTSKENTKNIFDLTEDIYKKIAIVETALIIIYIFFKLIFLGSKKDEDKKKKKK